MVDLARVLRNAEAIRSVRSRSALLDLQTELGRLEQERVGDIRETLATGNVSELAKLDPVLAGQLQQVQRGQQVDQLLQVRSALQRSITEPGAAPELLAPFAEVFGGVVPTADDPFTEEDAIQARENINTINQQLSALGVSVPQPVKKTVRNAIVDGKPVITLIDPRTGEQEIIEGVQPLLTSQDIEVGADGSISLKTSIVGQDEATPVTKTTRARLEKAFTDAQNQLDQLADIENRFDPEFLRASGKLRSTGLRTRDFFAGLLGVSPLNEEQRQFLIDESSFRASAAELLNATINALSGAATSEQEAARIKQAIPSPNDSPAEFVAKFDRKKEQVNLLMARTAYALQQGLDLEQTGKIGVPGISEGEQSIEQIMAERANQLRQELIEQGMTPEEARQAAIIQTRQEFGIR